MSFKFERVEYEVDERFSKLNKKKLHKALKKIAYEMSMKMEMILLQVVLDNPDIPIEDMTLRYNLNHIPVDIITKDGKILYDFEKEL